MLYLMPVRPWCPVPFNETGRRCLGLLLVLLCVVGLLLTAAIVIMSADIMAGMWRLRYFYPPSEHLFRPAAITLLHAALHAGVYSWFAVACFHSSRWQTRARYNEYISVMVFGFLVMSLCEHEIYVALYRGVRGWVHDLSFRIDRTSFFYKYSDEARAEVDRLQTENACCGGTGAWMWHLIDWIGLQDETFLPQSVQHKLRGMPWQQYTTREQHQFVDALSDTALSLLSNRSIVVCTDCPYIRPWSCCDPDRNAHRCLVPLSQLTWPVYQFTEMRNVNCTVGVYVTRFYDTMLDWGAVAEVMSWLDLLIALLAKYLDSASNEAMLSGQPDGPSRGYLMQRCCGWCCPKPGFMPEQPPPVPITFRAEEATSGIFGATDEGLERQLDEELEREAEQKQEWREDMRQQRRQQTIDRKEAKHREKMGLLDGDSDAGDDDDEGEMDRGVDDEVEDVEENDDWAGD